MTRKVTVHACGEDWEPIRSGGVVDAHRVHFEGVHEQPVFIRTLQIGEDPQHLAREVIAFAYDEVWAQVKHLALSDFEFDLQGSLILPRGHYRG